MESDPQQLRTFVGRGGQIRFCCPDCPFDHYSEQGVLRHWLASHSAEKQGMPLGKPLYDAEDKPLPQELYLPPALKKLL